jgi:hypothetical protein
MIKTSIDISDSDFLDSFSHIIKDRFLPGSKKTKLNLFVLNMNANDFDYESFKTRLVDPVIDYALSRKVKNKYKNKPGTQSKKAREKFKKEMNTGELGEFLLFCFLEHHLKAPKILTKMELKTSTSTYVHGSDGVHFLKLENGNYQLIFGESKTEKILTRSITNAFQSIYDFKKCINPKGEKKSGLTYEKSLINDEIEKETFSEEEKNFIEKLVYPDNNNFYVDDAFAIFIGYNIEITEDDRNLSNPEFRKQMQERIKKEVENKINHISNKINDFDLHGHHFYIYVLPFSQLDKNKKDIINHITS